MRRGRGVSETVDVENQYNTDPDFLPDVAYRYNGAADRIEGSQSADDSFNLLPGNSNPQGIADPPQSSDAGVGFAATDVNGDGETTIRDALMVINYLSPNSNAPCLLQLSHDANGDGLVTPGDALNVINR